MLPEIRTILYATNLGPEAPYVFRFALSQAQHYKAKVHVIHVLEPLGSFAKNLVEQYLSPEQSKEIQDKSRQAVIDRISNRLSAFCDQETCTLSEGSNIVADIQVVEGHPSDVIIKQAKAVNADLIVMGTHRHVRLSPSGFIGSTARQVINTSKVPVLTVYTPEDKLEEIET
jgi:nucleotide-binding universal stress UspA family protein